MDDVLTRFKDRENRAFLSKEVGDLSQSAFVYREEGHHRDRIIIIV